MTVPEALQLAIAHHQAGRLAEAEALYRQILAVQPNHADAWNLLGVIAQQAGRHDTAVEYIRRSVEQDPNNAGAHSNLGAALADLGRFAEAADACRRALQLQPGNPEACNNLGIVLVAEGRPGEAVPVYRRALDLRPEDPAAWCNLANALRVLEQLDEALDACRRALTLRPQFPDALNNLGSIFQDQGRIEDAVAAFRQALQLQPAHADACNNLGNALVDQGRFGDGVTALREASRLQPQRAEIHCNLGHALWWRRELDESVAACRRALQLEPGLPDAHLNLGNALRDQGQLQEAIGAFRQAVRLRPADAEFHSNLIYSLHFDPASEGALIEEEQARWNAKFDHAAARPDTFDRTNRNRDRRLRVGYVSPDLREHVVGLNLLPLLRHHEHREFEIACYSGSLRPDKVTEEFRRCADLWRETTGLSDEKLAATIRNDEIDILVDLTQHMAGNRLPMFALRPAPVQVSFAGYPESTGLLAIPSRISDRWLEELGMANTPRPQDSEFRIPNSEFSPERLFLLPSFWCYDPGEMSPAVNSSPAADSGRTTFGCLNNFCKVNEPMLRLWARVLLALPDSRLLILSAAGSHRRQVCAVMEGSGVASARVEFVEPRARKMYLELYHQVDIALDTFPYNGHTTSLDALWMGVPVVSLAGKRPVSRAGLSQLSNLGLPELVAHSEDEYVEIATRLGSDRLRLAEMRRTLRARMEGSVLMDAPHFARKIEQAYRAMWRDWCAR
jgi:predicted O-linked N-acetylglucosamine transferase (SPINDLY family)